MKAILIRVGIDGSEDSGKWNAPCNPITNDFVYVPIKQEKRNTPGMERYYSKLIVPALDRFSKRNNYNISLPDRLIKKRMHLDPDFECLTYGDTSSRGKKLLRFRENDLVIFYASLKPIYKAESDKLIYALIGMLVVEEVLEVKNISPKWFDENAHTRNAKLEPTDIVVRGKKGVSGRFEKYIPIGEWRNKAYRVKKHILDDLGGLLVKDGYIQRSANPPLFKDPERFYGWLKKQNPKLIQVNNP